MRQLGIFIGYSPYQLDPYQGISRLIGFVVKGALASGNTKVTIACPGWLRSDIEVLLDDAKIPLSSVDIIGTKGEPPLVSLWRLARRLRKKDKKPRGRSRVNAAVDWASELVANWLAARSLWTFVGGFLLGVLAIAVLAVPAMLLGLTGLLAVGLRRLLRKAWRSGHGQMARGIARRFIGRLSSRGIIDRVRASELNVVAGMINQRPDIKVWYVPSMFWPEVKAIKAKVVMAAPDLVFYEHPGQFTAKTDLIAYERILASLKHADHLICYSDHVKQAHFVQRNNIPPDAITVIRHGFVDLHSVGPSSKDQALEVLHRHIHKKKDDLPGYLQGFRFDDVPFFFYSSQARPHKNIEGLIKAYEKVLREDFRPAKLIVTADIASHPRLSGYVEAKGLQADVLSIKSVPNSVLSALYRLAAVSVTPTLFEGGFPFTFSEAYSVGTPSIMSRIPVVKEVVTDPQLQDLMTFDPANINDMAAKMTWALGNRNELLEAQRPLFEALSARTWAHTADDYLRVIGDVGDSAAAKV